ncbi:WcaF family extracellular polysaccharide biosynthesis acetyltransferase [Mongoliibacter ruber]|uniref:Putative colanic acid biosynthesis acetyltransferase WcaF n=1 Tax=Mongoliibacter ruber TaxID=1750599 RepID=A0A2T0WNU5_9BACT|nr:WcaF family extracellular polysaccharide biosynthesis acetyltransferase [Mongoliibacter ruber]PRY88362.1 putative colanic acid biosynthesis acetyltransferase WcaF [Mongoliibacter ruber]
MNKISLIKFDNSFYKPGSKVKILLWYLVNMFFFKSSFIFPSKFKTRILRIFGASVGKNVLIKPNVNIKYPWFLEIGDNVWIGEQVWIDNLAMVSISDNVCISQGAMLLCGNHNYKKETFDLIIGEILLEEGVWIGAKAVVCPGVKCFSHSILTVGSVATTNLNPYSIYQGNPALKIRERKISSC